MYMGVTLRPVGLTGALVVGALIGLGVFRDVRRSELKNKLSLTVCPRCEKMGKHNDGAKCDCGGEFVKTSEVRWVDGTQSEDAENSFSS